jgi:hypothetical protein
MLGDSNQGSGMYQPYPADASTRETQQRPARPPSVTNAVRLMYCGAALDAIGLIISLATLGSLRSTLHANYPHYSPSRLHTLETEYVAIVIISGLIAIALWLWMAWANNGGRNWARITGTVLFALDTIFFLISVARPHASLSLLFGALVWLIGLGAVMLLWRRDSSAYFTASR